MVKTRKKTTSKPLRVGVVGVSRGMSFANSAKFAGMELVALCDTWEERLTHACEQHSSVTPYTDFDKFLSHDMDAVILANFFHEHAPFAIKAMEAGFHVMSETTACATPAEAVALVECVEKTKKTYMLAENYCFFNYIQEMRRLYQTGEIGEMQLAECEYIHPMSPETLCQIGPGVAHWRNWCPSIYYNTHALGPILYITEERPVSVNARSIVGFPGDDNSMTPRQKDPGFTMLCQMSNNGTVICNGLTLRGHGNWYRVHGIHGLMENLRNFGNQHKLRIVHEEWDRKSDVPAEQIYAPDFPVHAEEAKNAGHGGGDFYTNYFFAEAIRNTTQPFLNVYRAVDMAMVAIQGWRSCLDNGATMEIPDFRKKAARKAFRDDHWTPFPDAEGNKTPDQPSSCLGGDKTPSRKVMSFSRKVWKQLGYQGK